MLFVRAAAVVRAMPPAARCATFSHLSAADRTAIREILLATKPEFAQRSKELLPRPAAQLGELGELPGAQAHEEAHAVTLRGG
jgi:hypothetical protein